MFSLQQAKRAIKAVRNRFVDPPPRDRTLALVSIVPDGSGIDFHYEALGASFRIRATLPPRIAAGITVLPAASLAQLLTALGISFAPFLFKLSDFARVEVRTAPLDDESLAFFEAFLVHGMGEFRYLQGLDPARPIDVRAEPLVRSLPPSVVPVEERLLMLNGGGKDTIVAAELLKAGGQPFTWLTIRPNDTRRRVIELSGVREALEVGYEQDANIARLSRYPWGHVPHTSIVLGFGVLAALVTRHRYVAAGNEFSSSSSNLRFNGMEVNHQYTKSFAFEHGFASFIRRCVTPSIEVFSVLRPFHDLQLARLFAAHRKYFPHFISCNRGIRSATWCMRCPKCAFTALALYPFLGREDMLSVFGEDPLQRPGIRRHVLELVTGSFKPWECVGTREESGLALRMLLDRNPKLQFYQAPSRARMEVAVADVDAASTAHRYLDVTQSAHAIPPAVLQRLNAGLTRTGSTLQVSPGRAVQCSCGQTPPCPAAEAADKVGDVSASHPMKALTTQLGSSN